MPIDYEKIRRKARAYAIKRGQRNDSDDFAQDCCLYAFEKQLAEVYIARRFSDFMAKYRGVPGSPRHRVDRAVSFDEAQLSHNYGIGQNMAFKFIEDEGLRYLNELTPDQRMIYVLYHKYEVPGAHIADARGVTGSMISKILAATQKELNKKRKRKGDHHRLI